MYGCAERIRTSSLLWPAAHTGVQVWHCWAPFSQPSPLAGQEVHLLSTRAPNWQQESPEGMAALSLWAAQPSGAAETQQGGQRALGVPSVLWKLTKKISTTMMSEPTILLYFFLFQRGGFTFALVRERSWGSETTMWGLLLPHKDLSQGVKSWSPSTARPAELVGNGMYSRGRTNVDILYG